MNRRQYDTPFHETRRAFTLVELLVVITIIAILSAIVTVAGAAMVRRARETAVAWEIAQLNTAVESYRTQNGDSYPIDFSNPALFAEHLRKIYPNHTEDVATYLATSGPSGGPVDIDGSEALVFFLGGGLFNNSEKPLSGPGEKRIFFVFEPTRLRDLDSDGLLSYFPKYGSSAPLVYFDSRTYSNANAVFPKPATTTYSGVTGVLHPYHSSKLIGGATVYPFMNPNTFQIIAAGLDQDYGADVAAGAANEKRYPEGTNYTLDDRDNIANFSEGGKFEDKLP